MLSKLRNPLVVVPFVGVALVCVGGWVVWDAGRDDVVAKGVHVGAVDVGGLGAGAAGRRLREQLVAALQRPLVVRAGGRAFALGAREARIRADVGAMVAAAVKRGRRGGILARTWRALTGGAVHASVAPRIGYSAAAVRRLVDRVRVAIDRKPLDAKVDFGPDDVTIRHSVIGRTVDVATLGDRVRAALVSGRPRRPLTVPIRRVKPKVAGGQLAKRYPTVITIDRAAFRLRLFKRLRLVHTYPIAVGQVGLETPAGLYAIHNKAINPAWHVPNSPWAGSLAGQVIPGGAPDNPLKARWLGVYDGVGVHGTDARGSIGSNASHGCIRMYIEDVIQLYDEVPLDTPIYIG